MRVRKEAIVTNMGRARKFVKHSEGVQLYNIGACKFRQLAHEAGTVYKVGKTALVNTEKFEKHLEGSAEA